ncbi:MAG: CIA30 family protein [bacterium]
MKKTLGFGFWIWVLAGLGGAAPLFGDINLDHFGYRTGDTKIAYCTADPGASLEVRDAATNALILTTTLVTDKGTDTSSPPMSGDHVWWVDFSALTTPGTYYLDSPTLNEQSYDFQISDTRYQAPVTAALKSLYYARCGTPKTAANGGAWTDAACHTSDATCTAFCDTSANYGVLNYGTLDLSGGWHDAGDYEKKIGPGVSCGVTETGDNGDTLWYLLTAYELNPGLFPPNQINLPESGDGLPDILNQAKWELDWYLKMQRPDGHVLEGVHVTNLGTLASPPSADTTSRGYMPPCYESEAVFTASTAHAARVFNTVTGGAAYAATLQAAALKTWNDWVLNSPAVDPHAISYLPYGELKVWAASEIFRMDPTQSAAQSIVDNYTNWSSFALNPAGPYADWPIFNYLQTPGATPSVTAAMETALNNYVNTLFSEDDLYHSGMAAWMYPWGSNQIKACAGLELFLSGRLGFTGSHTLAECDSHAEDFLHYFHGANPLNMVYMTNTDSMGAEHCVWHLFNSWFGQAGSSYSSSNFIGKPAAVIDPLYPYVPADNQTSTYGPPPGYVPDGPTYQYQQLGGTDTPPDLSGSAEAPYTKAYRDYCSGNQPWIVNEGGIYDTASYLALASVFAGSVFVTGTPTPTPVFSFTPTASPTPTPSFSPTPTFVPSAYCPATFIDNFENQSLNGTPPARTNLWGGQWTTLVSSASIGVTYNKPGADGSLYSAGVTGSVAFGGYAEWSCSLNASRTPFNAASYGIAGVELWVKGDGNSYLMEVSSQGVTNYDYYGDEIITPNDGQWHFYTIPFSAMTRQIWGTQTGLPATYPGQDVTGLVFVTQGTPAAFAFSADQIAFYCAAAPSPSLTPSLPTPTPPPSENAGLPLSLYPNPLTLGQTIHLYPALTSTSNVTIKIFTEAFRKIGGRIFRKVSPGQDLTLNLKNLSNQTLADGLYYVAVTTNRGQTVKKILVLN